MLPIHDFSETLTKKDVMHIVRSLVTYYDSQIKELRATI
jgi:hypothetical protein